MSLVRQKIGENIPNVIIENIVLEKSTTTIHAYILDYVYEEGVSTWFFDTEYRSMIEIEIQAKVGDTVTTLKVFSADNMDIDADYVNSKAGTDSFVKIPYKIILTEELNVDDLSELTITARSVISQDKITETKQTDFSASSLREGALQGKTDEVVVMKDSEVVTRDTGYFLGDSFYLGAKHQMPTGRWMTGATHTANSQQLLRRTIPNRKVSDFRTLMTGFEYVAYQKSEDYQPSYSSEIYQTRGVAGDLRFMFAIDYRSIYRDHAHHGNIFPTMSDRMQDRVLLFSRLARAELYRDRTDINDEEDKNISIVTSGEEQGDSFNQVVTDTCDLKEEELNFQKGTLFFRTFSVTDKQFKRFSDGTYKYSVNLSVDDGITRALRFQKEDLDKAKAILSSYEGELALKGNNDDGKISAAFYDQIKERYDFENRPYVRAMVALVEASFAIIGHGDRKRLNVFSDTVRHLLSPRTATTTTIARAISLMNDAITKIGDWLDNDAELPTDVALSPAQFELDFNLRGEARATDSFKSGLSFLSSDSVLEDPNSIGIQSVQGQDYEARVQEENKRFTGESQSRSFVVGDYTSKSNGFGFLTPTAARAGPSVYMFYKNGNNGFSENVKVHTLRDPSTDSQSIFPETSKLSYEIHAVENSEDLTSDFGGTAPSENQQQTIGDFMSRLSTSEKKSLFDGIEIVSQGEDNVIVKGLDLKDRVLTLENFDNLPSHIKAILTGNANGTVASELSTAIAGGTRDKYDLTLGSILEIQALSGYSDIGESNFLPLTELLYLRNSGKRLLCRARLYDNNSLNYNPSDVAAIFNNYFIIDVPTMAQNDLQRRLNTLTDPNAVANVLSDAGLDPTEETAGSVSNACSTVQAVSVEESMLDADLRSLNLT